MSLARAVNENSSASRHRGGVGPWNSSVNPKVALGWARWSATPAAPACLEARHVVTSSRSCAVSFRPTIQIVPVNLYAPASSSGQVLHNPSPARRPYMKDLGKLAALGAWGLLFGGFGWHDRTARPTIPRVDKAVYGLRSPKSPRVAVRGRERCSLAPDRGRALGFRSGVWGCREAGKVREGGDEALSVRAASNAGDWRKAECSRAFQSPWQRERPPRPISALCTPGAAFFRFVAWTRICVGTHTMEKSECSARRWSSFSRPIGLNPFLLEMSPNGDTTASRAQLPEVRRDFSGKASATSTISGTRYTVRAAAVTTLS